MRSIRSFVLRTGRLTPGQERALETLWPRFGCEYGDESLDLDALFGRRAARVLEIGFGNGETLLQSAAEHPELDFLGLEVHAPGVGHCLIGAEQADLSNLRIIRHDAIAVLKTQIPEQSLERINLYFPDPWPKKRHHKRRIVQPRFLRLAASRLAAGGSLNIATDWADYADHIDELLVQCEQFEVSDRREHSGENALDRPTTRFESRGLKKGHRITDWRAIRI